MEHISLARAEPLGGLQVRDWSAAGFGGAALPQPRPLASRRGTATTAGGVPLPAARCAWRLRARLLLHHGSSPPGTSSMQPPDVAKALQALAAAILGGGAGGGGGGGSQRLDRAAVGAAPLHAAASDGGQAPRPSAGGKSHKPKPWRDGDWLCGHCGEHNFGSRASPHCFRCGGDRSWGGKGRAKGGGGGKGGASTTTTKGGGGVGSGGGGGCVGKGGGVRNQPQGAGGTTPMLGWPSLRNQQPAAASAGYGGGSGGGGGASASSSGGGASLGGKANRGRKIESGSDGFSTVLPKAGTPQRRWAAPGTAAAATPATTAATSSAGPGGEAAGKMSPNDAKEPTPPAGDAKQIHGAEGDVMEVDVCSDGDGERVEGNAPSPQGSDEPSHQQLRGEWAELERQAAVMRSAGIPRESPGYVAAVEAAAKAKERWHAARPEKPLRLRIRNQRKQLDRAEKNRAWWEGEVDRIEKEYASHIKEARTKLQEAQDKETCDKEKMRRLQNEELEGDDDDGGRVAARGAAEAMGEAEQLNRALAPQLEKLAAMAENQDDGDPQRLLINEVLSGFQGINSVFERARGARLRWAEASMDGDEEDYDDDADDDRPADDSTDHMPRGDGTTGAEQRGTHAAGAPSAEQLEAAERERVQQQLQLQHQQEEAQRQAHAQAMAAQATAAAAAVRTQAQAARAEAEASFPSELKLQLAAVVNTAQGCGVDFFEDLVQNGFTVQAINASMLQEHVRNKGWA